jgi:hypothetical protein
MINLLIQARIYFRKDFLAMIEALPTSSQAVFWGCFFWYAGWLYLPNLIVL